MCESRVSGDKIINSVIVKVLRLHCPSTQACSLWQQGGQNRTHHNTHDHTHQSRATHTRHSGSKGPGTAHTNPPRHAHPPPPTHAQPPAPMHHPSPCQDIWTPA